MRRHGVIPASRPELSEAVPCQPSGPWLWAKRRGKSCVSLAAKLCESSPDSRFPCSALSLTPGRAQHVEGAWLL